MTYEAQIGRVIPLGRVGENEITEVAFDYSCWLDAYGEGEFRLVHRRNCDSAALPIEIAAEGGRITWTLTEADTAAQGEGEAQLTYFASSGKIKKSAIYKTMTTRSLTSGENTPQPYRGFVDTVLAAAQTAETAAAAAQAAQTGAETAQAAAEGVVYEAAESAAALLRETNVLHGLVDYGYDEHQTLKENPDSGVHVNRMGADRLWMRTVLSSSNPPGYTTRVKISGDIARAATNADVDAWSEGIILEGGRTYRATMTLVSGTVTPPEGTTLPSLSIYPVGSHNSVGTAARVDNRVYYRTYTVPEGGAEVNLAIYVNARIVLDKAQYIVTLEDITEGLDAHSLREDVDRIDAARPENNAYTRKLGRMVGLFKTPAETVSGTMPRQNGVVGETEYYDEGTVIPAVVYSSVWSEGRDVYRNLTLETYYSMLANPASELYTKNSTDLGLKMAHAYYGGVCSSYVSWACGFGPYWTSSAMNSFLPDKELDSFEELEVGDILWHTGHVSMISQVLTDSEGRVRYVDVSEQAGVTFQTTRRSIENFVTWAKNNGYKVKVNPNGTRINRVTDAAFDPNVIFERGNNTYLTVQELSDEDFAGAWFYIPNHDTVYARKNGRAWTPIALSGVTAKTVNGTTVYDLSGAISDEVPHSTNGGTSNGVTFTYNGNGTFNVNGTASGTAFLRLVNSDSQLPDGMVVGGTYSLEYSTTDPDVELKVYKYVNGTYTTPAIATLTADGTFTIPEDATGLQIRLSVASGKTANNATVSVKVHGSYTGDYEFAEREDAEKTCLIRVIDTGTADLTDDTLTLAGWSANCRPVSWILLQVSTTDSPYTPRYHLPEGYKGSFMNGNNRGSIDAAGENAYTIDFAEAGFAPAEGTAYMVWLEYDTGLGYKQAFSNIQGDPDPDPDPGPDPDEEED